jgi:TPP-dependent 2-oxoacid decarboxylase
MHRLPHDVLFIGQPLWASIGYTLPAFLGGALAAPDRRPVVLIGDGAAQLTIAELGTVLRNGIGGLVLIVDNDGYTVEKAIHGADAAYNSIARWDWAALARAMAGEADLSAVRVTTVGELTDALTAAESNSSRLTVIQAVLPANDIPPLLMALAAQASRANARPLAP